MVSQERANQTQEIKWQYNGTTEKEGNGAASFSFVASI